MSYERLNRKFYSKHEYHITVILQQSCLFYCFMFKVSFWCKFYVAFLWVKRFQIFAICKRNVETLRWEIIYIYIYIYIYLGLTLFSQASTNNQIIEIFILYLDHRIIWCHCYLIKFVWWFHVTMHEIYNVFILQHP